MHRFESHDACVHMKRRPSVDWVIYHLHTANRRTRKSLAEGSLLRVARFESSCALHVYPPPLHTGPSIICRLRLLTSSPIRNPWGLCIPLYTRAGALHLMFAEVSYIDSSKFYSNQAEDGSGGALYCNNVDKLTVFSSKFRDNTALWGGAVATFSSGGESSATSTTSDLSSLTTTTRQVKRMARGEEGLGRGRESYQSCCCGRRPLGPSACALVQDKSWFGRYL